MNTNNTITPYTSFFSMVSSNKYFFNKFDIERAEKALDLQEHLGWPSTPIIKDITHNNILVY